MWDDQTIRGDITILLSSANNLFVIFHALLCLFLDFPYLFVTLGVGARQIGGASLDEYMRLHTGAMSLYAYTNT
jgi:hypothetical protein